MLSSHTVLATHEAVFRDECSTLRYPALAGRSIDSVEVGGRPIKELFPESLSKWQYGASGLLIHFH